MPETRQPIENALIKDLSLLDRPLEHQFQKLIINPILALPNLKLLRSPMRIIINALDECEDHHFIPQLIETITCINYSKFPVIFLFTSRREEYICRTFESSPLNIERWTDTSLLQTSMSDSQTKKEKRLQTMTLKQHHPPSSWSNDYLKKPSCLQGAPCCLLDVICIGTCNMHSLYTAGNKMRIVL